MQIFVALLKTNTKQNIPIKKRHGKQTSKHASLHDQESVWRLEAATPGPDCSIELLDVVGHLEQQPQALWDSPVNQMSGQCATMVEQENMNAHVMELCSTLRSCTHFTQGSNTLRTLRGANIFYSALRGANILYAALRSFEWS